MISDEPTLTLSLVVPAYNEVKRIDKMMAPMLEHLRQTEKADKCVHGLKL